MILKVPGDVGAPPPRVVPAPDYSGGPRCDHPRRELRRMRMSNGIWRAVKQCLACGHSDGSGVRKADLPNFDSLPEFDEVLRSRWVERSREFYDQARSRYEAAIQSRDAAWQRWYAAYLSSPKWAGVRAVVLERDHHWCQGCRGRRATQVHHLTYDRVGNELLFDLVAVCDDCHRRCHPDKG